MRFTSTETGIQVPSDTFRCTQRRKVLTLNRCQNDFLESNAFGLRRASCFRCPTGRRNREIFAGAEQDES